MDQQRLNTEAVVRYLLGEAEGRERIERSLADDEAFFDFVLIEDRLIFDYLNNRLPPAEHDLFEQKYLTASSGRRERVALAQVLNARAREWNIGTEAAQGRYAPDKQVSALTISWASRLRNVISPYRVVLTTLLVTVSVCVFFMLRYRRQLADLEAARQMELRSLQQQLSQKDQELQQQRQAQESLRVQNESLKQQRDELAQAIESGKRDTVRQRAAARPTEREFEASLQVDEALDPSGERGASENKKNKRIIARRASVNLYLRLIGDVPIYQSYSAELETSSPPMEFKNLSPRLTRYGEAVVITLSTLTLKRGPHAISLLGHDPGQGPEAPAGTYRFTVK